MGAPELLQFALAGLKNGSIYALVALGFTIVYASTGVINFAQGEFVMLGGMLSVWAHSTLGLPLPLAALIGILGTAVIGVVFELLAIRPRKDGDPLALIIITVGGSLLLSNLARHVFGPSERSLPAFTAGPSLRFLGATLERQSLWIFGLTALAVVVLTVFYSRTRLGRAMRACSINRTAARLVGVDPKRLVTISFALAAALGGLAGVVTTPLTQTAFNVGSSFGIKGFAAAILGGLGNPIAAVIGGLVLGLLESMSIAFLSSTYKDAISLVVLLLVLFIRPQGLLGRGGREKV
ncbi:MAG: branched-chain amino acid ABC transporter permease [Actinobacteria bacterium]|nr:branched-chain amino acid ABC transporter permease [Actinomycetota bacterium]MCG2808589.1 branched-chain amino acid ABC transporter permease [Coriobacteriia bacterium]